MSNENDKKTESDRSFFGPDELFDQFYTAPKVQVKTSEQLLQELGASPEDIATLKKDPTYIRMAELLALFQDPNTSDEDKVKARGELKGIGTQLEKEVTRIKKAERGLKVYDVEVSEDGKSCSGSWSDPTTVGRRVRHFKGGEYLVTGKGYLDVPGQDKGEPVILYMSRETMTLWVRPEKDFTAEVTWPDGKVRTRFMADSEKLRGITSTSRPQHSMVFGPTTNKGETIPLEQLPNDPSMTEIFRKSVHKKVETEEPIEDSPEATLDLLSLVIEGVQALPGVLDHIRSWTPEERTQADNWAASQVLLASDLNPEDLNEIPPKPAFVANLERLAKEAKDNMIDELREQFRKSSERADKKLEAVMSDARKKVEDTREQFRKHMTQVKEVAEQLNETVDDIKRQEQMANDAEFTGRAMAQAFVEELGRIARVETFLATLPPADKDRKPENPETAMAHLMLDFQYRKGELEGLLGLEQDAEKKREIELGILAYEDSIKLARERLASCLPDKKTEEKGDDK